MWIGAISTREERPERAPDRDLVREIREGLSFVLRHRLLRAITATTGTSNLFSAILNTAFIIVLADQAQLNLSAGTIGLVFTVGSLGALLGAVVAERVARRVGQGPTIWLSILVAAPFTLVTPLVQQRMAAVGGGRLLGRGQPVHAWSTTSPRCRSGRGCARSGCSAG